MTNTQTRRIQPPRETSMGCGEGEKFCRDIAEGHMLNQNLFFLTIEYELFTSAIRKGCLDPSQIKTYGIA